MRPEGPAAGQSQQCRRKSQRSNQHNNQADRDGDSRLTELAEVGKDHHSDSADDRSSAGDKRFTDFGD